MRIIFCRLSRTCCSCLFYVPLLCPDRVCPQSVGLRFPFLFFGLETTTKPRNSTLSTSRAHQGDMGGEGGPCNWLGKGMPSVMVTSMHFMFSTREEKGQVMSVNSRARALSPQTSPSQANLLLLLIMSSAIVFSRPGCLCV